MATKQNKETRGQFKAVRESLSESDRREFSRAASDRFLALLDNYKGANIFLCFYPFGSEIEFIPTYKRLLEEGKELYFPVSDIGGHQLHFFKVSDLEKDFHEGAYGIMEPNDSLSELKDFEKDIIAITPGLIFDENCNRCGYGAGFYDRLFAKYPNIIKIGVAYDSQVVKQLETREYDIPLDYLVTNNRLIKRGRL